MIPIVWAFSKSQLKISQVGISTLGRGGSEHFLFFKNNNLSPEGVVRYTRTPLLTSKLQESCKTYIIHISIQTL